MKKSLQPRLPLELPNILSGKDGVKPKHDATCKNAVISFYNEKNPLPGVVFTCEHSSNVLPPQYKWSANDQKNFAGKHWAWDIGCLRLALGLSEAMKSAVCWAKYSRLLCDVNRTPGVSTMFRKKGDGLYVELNKGKGYRNGLEMAERSLRLNDYWFGYWNGVKKLLANWKVDNKNPKSGINPKRRYVFSIHSYTSKYQNEVRKLQVGILCTHFPALAEYFRSGFVKAGYNAKVNEPYNACHGPNNAGTCGCLQGESAASRFFQGYNKEGKESVISEGIRHIVFEIRNDLLIKDKQFTKIKKLMVKLINNLFKKGVPELKINRPICKDSNPEQIEFDNAVVLNWGKHCKEGKCDTRICFSAENCTVNSIETMTGQNLPKELEILMKKNQLGSPNVQQLAIKMAQEFNTILLSTKYSKAICDVTKPPTSQHVIPEKIQFFENGKLSYQDLPFNKNLSEKEEELRIKKYYIGFYNGFQFIRSELGVQPSYWISFRYYNKGHVHPNLLKKLNISTLPDIILNTQFFPHVAARLGHALQYPQMINTSLKVDVNGLINPKMYFDYANHAYCNSVTGRACSGIIVYVNQDTIDKNFDKVFNALKVAFEKVCFEMHDSAETFRFLG